MQLTWNWSYLYPEIEMTKLLKAGFSYWMEHDPAMGHLFACDCVEHIAKLAPELAIEQVLTDAREVIASKELTQEKLYVLYVKQKKLRKIAHIKPPYDPYDPVRCVAAAMLSAISWGCAHMVPDRTRWAVIGTNWSSPTLAWFKEHNWQCQKMLEYILPEVSDPLAEVNSRFRSY